MKKVKIKTLKQVVRSLAKNVKKIEIVHFSFGVTKLAEWNLTYCWQKENQ